MFRMSSVRRAIVRLVAFMIVASIALPVSPATAKAIGDRSRRFFDDAFSTMHGLSQDFRATEQDQEFAAQQAEDPSRNATRVTHFRLCPRHLLLYVGEDFTLSPVPLGHGGEAVQGVSLQWSSTDPAIASVTTGEVEAIAPGRARITVEAGTAQAHVDVEVRAGNRPKLTDEAWEMEHANDCDGPEAMQPADPSANPASHSLDAFDAPAAGAGQSSMAMNAKNRSALRPAKWMARPAALRVTSSPTPHAAGAVVKRASAVAPASKFTGRGLYQIGVINDGESTISETTATGFTNTTGTARFAPQEVAQGPLKTKNNLGSYNYVFTAPVLALGGRGIGVNLGLTFNSRIWTKDTTMVFDYNKGWPAPGWSMGYGRLIKNYDNTASGDQSGVGSANKPGNYLLIQPDGSHVHLSQSYDSVAGVWGNDSDDGTFIHLNPRNNRLIYSDGMQVNYNYVNNRLLPVSLRSTNGDLVTIAYRTFSKTTFPVRWAIDSITDTLGRVIQFHYYGDDSTTYAWSEPAKPQYGLATVTAPDQAGGTRTLVWLQYQALTLQHNFSIALDANAPATGTPISVLSLIYYPATGMGYKFQDYSTYGMPRRIPMV
jgi:Bacterial Ig-like domain (group 2).